MDTPESNDAQSPAQGQSQRKSDEIKGCLLLTVIGLVLLFIVTRSCSTSSGEKIASEEVSVAVPPVAPAAVPSPSPLGPAQRFTEFGEGHPLRAAQDALNAGDIDGAIALMSGGGGRGSEDAGRKQRLWAAIQKASDTQLNRSPGADYVERVQTHWLPQVEALPSSPAAGAAVGDLLSQMEALHSYVADGEKLNLTSAQRAVRSRFSSALSAKQRLLFPAIRRRYAEELNAQLFRRDIAVTTAGTRGRTLRITGPIFVRNANIEDMQKELTPVLARMRFGRVEYRWSRNAGEATYYDLKPPADDDVTAQ